MLLNLNNFCSQPFKSIIWSWVCSPVTYIRSPETPPRSYTFILRDRKRPKAQANPTISDEKATSTLDYQKTGEISTFIYNQLQTTSQRTGINM